MTAMRVYELAKKLGMENKDLIPELKKMGASVASHSSALDEDTVRKALEKLGCDLGQGFAWSPALTEGQLRTWWKTHGGGS